MGTGSFIPVSVDLSGSMSGISPYSVGPVISGDGHYVLFYSAATNLVTDPDSYGTVDLFIRDLQAGATKLVSVDNYGSAAGANDQDYPAVSYDGHYVLFTTTNSSMTGLADTNGATDVLLRDTVSNRTAMVSVNAAGTAAASGPGGYGLSDSVGNSMSADGRHIAFLSFATNVTGFPGIADVYARDMQSETTVMVSLNRTNTARGNGYCFYPAVVSTDGQRVFFLSDAHNLVPGIDTYPGAGEVDLFMRDLTRQRTSLLSINSRAREGIGVTSASNISVSTNGVVVFSSGYATGVNVFFRHLPP